MSLHASRNLRASILFHSPLACRHLHQLLGDLIQLQTLLLTKSKETQHLISGTSQPSSGKLSEKEEEDEEIPSNSEDEMSGEEEGDNMQFKTAGRRKRKRFDSCTIPEGERDFEREIDERHGSIRPYRDAVISKWNEKTRLSSGKITSKVSLYIKVDDVLNHTSCLFTVIHGCGSIHIVSN